MSESNPFEIHMQEKLDDFRIEPAASDWQSIYERLHPRNKRRIIWWWLPLVAALGAGIFWANKININSPAAIVAANPAAVTEKKSSGQKDYENSSALQKDNLTDKTGPGKENDINPSVVNNPVAKGETKKSSTHAIGKNISRPEKEVGKKALTSETPNKKPGPFAISAPLVENNEAVKNSTAKSQEKSSSANEEKKFADNSSPSAKGNNVAIEKSSPLAVDKILTDEKTTALTEVKKLTGEKSSTLSEEKKQIQENPSASPEEKKASETSTNIPVKENVSRWKWAAYLGAGPNYPSDPISLGPTAMVANAPDYSGGNARTYTNSSNENGWHFNTGIMAEKKLGKDWIFSTGIGVNTNTWKTTIEKFKDSIFSGSLQSRYKLYSEQQKYQLWMAEIPLQFSNRLSGKKAGSLWWTIGLNNQFTLRLKQQITADSLQGSQLSDSRSLTSSARFYQPRLRLGVMYNHDSKVHWQLLPLFQYTLTGVFSTDPPDNPYLVNLQLQYRLFFRGKKETMRSKK